MKRGLTIALILIVVISGFVSAGFFDWFKGKIVRMSPGDCVDTDEGIDEFVYGIVEIPPSGNFFGIKSNDWCSDDYTLREKFCNNEYAGSVMINYLGEESITCEFGCSNGACKTVEDNLTFCTDSDGGKKYSTKGYTEKENPNTGGKITEYDNCVNTSSVIERYCNELDNLDSEIYICPNGCRAGSCLTESDPVCIESDEGIDYYAHGITCEYNTCRPDSCTSTPETGKMNNLIEWYCDENNSLQRIDYICPEGYLCVSPVGSNEPSAKAFCRKHESPQICVDSDKGINFDEKGSTYGFQNYYNKYVNVTDYCTETQLTEGYCEGVEFYQTWTVCENGCKDGACIVGEQSCTDTCTSLGDSCGIQTICGINTNCGPCNSNYHCSAGSCIQNTTNHTTISSSNQDAIPIGGVTTPSSKDEAYQGFENYDKYYSKAEGNEYPSEISDAEFKVNVKGLRILGETVEATSTIKLLEEEGMVYAAHFNRETGKIDKIEIKVSPDDVVGLVEEIIESGEIKGMKVEDGEEGVVYNVHVEKPVKLVGFIKMNINIFIKVNVNSGEVVSVKKPWWKIFAWGV